MSEPKDESQRIAETGEPLAGEVPSAKEEKIATAADSGEQESLSAAVTESDADEKVEAASRRHTRRAFLVAAVGTTAAYAGYRYLYDGPTDEMQPTLLRRAFRFNARLSRAVFQDEPLAPTYPLKRAETLRVNGVYGLKKMLNPETWRLQTAGVRNALEHPRYVKDVTAWQYEYSGADGKEDEGHDTKVAPKDLLAAMKATAGKTAEDDQDENHTGRKPRGLEEAGESDSTLLPGTPGLLLTIEDLLKLPRHEFVTQFKCIEGWSQIVHWAGVRVADFMEAYPPQQIDGREPKYVYMETPDGDYYTGYELQALRHPQALLVTEMMGAPLTQFHGAPLRLHMPTKYGYKQIKRIGLFAYTQDKPDDYWTKLGYDWAASL